MTVNVKISETDNWLCRQTVSTNSLTDETQLALFSTGRLTGRLTSAGGFLLYDTQWQLQQPVRLAQYSEGDLIQLHFLLRGGTWQERTEAGVTRSLADGQHTISYHPSSAVEIELTSQTEIIDYFTIYVAQTLYFQLVPPASALHASFARRIEQKQASYLASQNLPITPAMSRLIDTIRHCEREGELRRLYIQVKVIELLMLQLEQHQQAQLGESTHLPPDQQKVQEAKAILENRFARPPTINELARLVGLNEFKLKKGFRELVGCPIYSYVVKLRMEQARQWLLERDKSIGEVAHYVGYKNHAHFTAAYKQYYNSLPSELTNRKHW
jgi:AraC-like DNA-binding protein